MSGKGESSLSNSCLDDSTPITANREASAKLLPHSADSSSNSEANCSLDLKEQGKSNEFDELVQFMSSRVTSSSFPSNPPTPTPFVHISTKKKPKKVRVDRSMDMDQFASMMGIEISPNQPPSLILNKTPQGVRSKNSKSYGIPEPFRIERFIRSNFRLFFSQVSNREVNMTFTPDMGPSWPSVSKVEILTAEPINSGSDHDVRCPICLETNMIAPRVAKCGHYFCYPCILRHLAECRECPPENATLPPGIAPGSEEASNLLAIHERGVTMWNHIMMEGFGPGSIIREADEKLYNLHWESLLRMNPHAKNLPKRLSFHQRPFVKKCPLCQETIGRRELRRLKLQKIEAAIKGGINVNLCLVAKKKGSCIIEVPHQQLSNKCLPAAANKNFPCHFPVEGQIGSHFSRLLLENEDLRMQGWLDDHVDLLRARVAVLSSLEGPGAAFVEEGELLVIDLAVALLEAEILIIVAQGSNALLCHKETSRLPSSFGRSAPQILEDVWGADLVRKKTLSELEFAVSRLSFWEEKAKHMCRSLVEDEQVRIRSSASGMVVDFSEGALLKYLNSDEHDDMKGKRKVHTDNIRKSLNDQWRASKEHKSEKEEKTKSSCEESVVDVSLSSVAKESAAPRDSSKHSHQQKQHPQKQQQSENSHQHQTAPNSLLHSFNYPRSCELEEFYQTPLGEWTFISPLSLSVLMREFAVSEGGCLPPVLKDVPVLDSEKVVMDEHIRKSIKFLNHIPLGTEVTLLHLDFSKFNDFEAYQQKEASLVNHHDDNADEKCKNVLASTSQSTKTSSFATPTASVLVSQVRVDSSVSSSIAPVTISPLSSEILKHAKHNVQAESSPVISCSKNDFHQPLASSPTLTSPATPLLSENPLKLSDRTLEYFLPLFCALTQKIQKKHTRRAQEEKDENLRKAKYEKEYIGKLISMGVVSMCKKKEGNCELDALGNPIKKTTSEKVQVVKKYHSDFPTLAIVSSSSLSSNSLTPKTASLNNNNNLLTSPAVSPAALSEGALPVKQKSFFKKNKNTQKSEFVSSALASSSANAAEGVTDEEWALIAQLEAAEKAEAEESKRKCLGAVSGPLGRNRGTDIEEFPTLGALSLEHPGDRKKKKSTAGATGTMSKWGSGGLR
eukprot:GDKJ01013517.1.p1 GENE.GDKJ01013517.1~~GDKJ01013517.1.p1  ORF type:complete len:1127 (-),score=301.13 GDKJ01013517.1:106-3486(-)